MNQADSTHTGPILVLFDADRIRDYVFRTGRLKEIRGGSMLVRETLDKEHLIEHLAETGHDVADQLIFAGGGAGLAVFDTPAEADTFTREIKTRYRSETSGATLTAVSIPQTNGFGAAVRQGELELRAAKAAQDQPHQLTTGPYVRFCDSCARAPVQHLYTLDQPHSYLCDICHTKRVQQDTPGSTDRQFSDTWYGQDFIAGIQDSHLQSAWQQAVIPRELNELGDMSRTPRPYIGFIYADGNHMGNKRHQLETREDFEQFSTVVQQSTRDAILTALRQAFPKPRWPPGDSRRIAPFVLILAGGDDIILITVADKALAVAQTFAEEFQRRSETAGHPVTTSVGVVLSHPTQPIVTLEERAHQLVAQAKRYADQYADKHPIDEVSAINFLVVTSATLNPVPDIMRNDYGVKIPDRPRATLRPYTLDEVTDLLHHIHAFQSGDESQTIPRNKLNSIYEATRISRDQAIYEGLTMRWRLNDDQRAKIDEFQTAFNGTLTDFPWGKDITGEGSALTDLVELLDFNRPGQEEVTNA